MENNWNTTLNHTHTHKNSLSLSLHSWVQTMTLSIHSSIQSEEFTFSSIPMTALLTLVFMHSWQHNCRGQDNTWRPQKDMWRYEMPQSLFGVLAYRKTTTGAIYPWQQEVILRLNVDPCQSGCILISYENCWYKWNRHVCLCMQKQ